MADEIDPDTLPEPIPCDTPTLYYARAAARKRRAPISRMLRNFLSNTEGARKKIVEEWYALATQDDCGDPKVQKVKLDAIVSITDRLEGRPYTRGEIRQKRTVRKEIVIRSGSAPQLPKIGSHLSDADRRNKELLLPCESNPVAMSSRLPKASVTPTPSTPETTIVGSIGGVFGSATSNAESSEAAGSTSPTTPPATPPNSSP